MPKKTYITSMPDRAGAFLRASEIISGEGGNIIRVGYNKALDLHTLFIDVEADEAALERITGALSGAGFLSRIIPDARVIVIEITMPDRPGALLPVLKILSRYEINISYMNSSANGTPFQHFVMGLLVEDPEIIKRLLDEIGKLYPINVQECGGSEKNLDNTVFYIRLANEMQKLLGLSPQETMDFISESNRVLLVLEEHGEDPAKVFDYIRRFARFVSGHRGASFRADVEKLAVSPQVTLYSIEPPCGSNTYVLESKEGLLLIDTGYAVYAGEMLSVLRRLFPGFDERPKRVAVTHADVDHCGLLSVLGAPILLNRKSADGLIRQRRGDPDYREDCYACYGYSRLSRIISRYRPPDDGLFDVIDSATPADHRDLLPIGSLKAGDMDFTVYEGSGGHVYGETVFFCEKYGLAFTGDILVNISGFTQERAQFNSLAPYLMGSVNVDSKKANEMRRQTTRLIARAGETLGRPCVVCGGHGPVSLLVNGALAADPGVNHEVIDAADHEVIDAADHF